MKTKFDLNKVVESSEREQFSLLVFHFKNLLSHLGYVRNCPEIIENTC